MLESWLGFLPSLSLCKCKEGLAIGNWLLYSQKYPENGSTKCCTPFLQDGICSAWKYTTERLLELLVVILSPQYGAVLLFPFSAAPESMMDAKRWTTARWAWVGDGGVSFKISFLFGFYCLGVVMFCLGTRASHMLDNCWATSPALPMVFSFETQYHCVVLEVLILLPQPPKWWMWRGSKFWA